VSKLILETDRLILREFNLTDSEFILKLVNAPSWLQFIGDKNVHSLADAEMYLEEGPMKSYEENGFGLWLVSIKDDSTPIGICGLINRPTLEDIDIGFALLPEYEGFGYAYEVASATQEYGTNTLDISKIIAITDPTNTSSIKLLKKLGLYLDSKIEEAEYGASLLFSNTRYLFTSERLGFRNWLDSDIKPMAAINVDPKVMEFFPTTQSLEHT